MSTQAEIEKQINDEFQKFFSSVYQNPLPADLIETFKKAIMVVPFGQLHTEKVRLMTVKKVKELTLTEVGIIVNKIMEVPFEKLYKDLQTALNKHEQLENVVIDFNMAKRAKEVELSQKKQTLYDLSGVNNKRSNILAKA